MEDQSNLILSRRVGEAFLIGKNVKITIVGINGGKVKVSIRAPKDVLVTRTERFQGRAQELHEFTDGKR